MTPVELLLVRHGESEGNVAAARAHEAGAEEIDVPARDADVHLSDLGREQAAALGRAIGAWSHEDQPVALAVSTYVRAQETARIVLDGAGLSLPTRVDERLRDRELGVLDRLTFAGVQARFPEEAERRHWQGKFYHRPAGGESWVDVALRLRSWVGDLDRTAYAPGAGVTAPARLLVVAHDVVLALLRYVCEGLDEQQVLVLARDTPLRNASLSRLVRAEDGTWTCTAYDDVEHLREAGLEATEHEGERRA
ncbi:MAG: Phosphoglycerate mutase [Marmoricola sp.]|nr:Phosphoglycerate mutase [Marmoricola sp.]